MNLTRRDMLRASSAIAVGLGLQGCSTSLPNILNPDNGDSGTPNPGTPGSDPPPTGDLAVMWLQGQTCSGCSVSLLNSAYYTTIDQLLLNSIRLDYHPTLMAAAGAMAVGAAEATYAAGNYVLVIEGAIPTAGNGQACSTWDGMTMLQALTRFADKAAYILSVGTCASYGGIPAGNPNPTLAKGVADALPGKSVIKLPGCPAHPDWVVGTIAYLMKYGQAPTLDGLGRPADYYSATVHSRCPLRETDRADTLGVAHHCLRELGCKGPITHADCPYRRWNSPGASQLGQNWCIAAGSPCIGCTEPSFPDGTSPFYFGAVSGGGGGDD